MRADPNVLRRLARLGMQLSIAAVGAIAIVGSGGGGFFELDCIPFDAPCDGGGGVIPPPTILKVEVVPSIATATVGGSVVFKARLNTNLSAPSYQWCRMPPGSNACADILGATSDSYTAAALNLADDGAYYLVKLTNVSPTPLVSNGARLAVSPTPAIVFQDGDFLQSDWSTSAIVSPAQNGPTYNMEHAATGGNPGAFVSVQYSMPQGTSSVRLVHAALSAVHDPSLQGAIYTIDFTEDCRGATGPYEPYTVPMIRQAGRTYVANSLKRNYCASTAWEAAGQRGSLVASDFTLIDGPACGASESCPDFSAAGAAIQLGLVSGASVASGKPAGTAAHGFDNWRAAVWRR